MTRRAVIVSAERGARFMRTGLHTRSIRAARLCDRWQVPRHLLTRRPDGLWLDPVDLPFDVAAERPWLLRNLAYAASLRRHAGARFSSAAAGELGVQIGSLNLLAQSAEDLFTLEELFVQRVYGWEPVEPTVVIDIGMNVGFSSLAFASKDAVIRVYGFEPFIPTYRQALRNLALNPGSAAKVHPRNIGVAAERATRSVEYDADHRGSVGLFGLSPWLEPGAQLSDETIELEPAVVVVDEIREKHPRVPIALKIDCEGAEYQIVASLAAAGRLAALSLLMIEWHRRADDHDPARLVASLSDAGFHVFQLGCAAGVTGMLYAARRTSASGHLSDRKPCC